jgi:hypothetical protein
MGCKSFGTKFYVGMFVKDDDTKVRHEHTLSALPVIGDLGFIRVELVQLEHRASATYHMKGSCFSNSAHRSRVRDQLVVAVYGANSESRACSISKPGHHWNGLECTGPAASSPKATGWSRSL